MTIPRESTRIFERLALVALLALPAASRVAAQQEAIDAARDQLRTGRYEEAIETLEGAEQRSTVATRLLVEGYRAVGRYDDAIEELRAALPGGRQLANLLGEVLVLRGERAEAERLFQLAVDERHADELTARVNLAELWFDRGELERAEELLFTLIDAYNSRSELAAADLVAVGRACQRLGRVDPQLFQDSLRAYDEAIEAEPSWTRPQVLVAELFLEKYDSTEARESLIEVLVVNPEHPEARLALAKVLHFDGSPKALELVEGILETNPRSVPTLVLHSRILLQLEQFDDAAERARRALEIDAGSLEALSALAAAHFLADDEEEFERARAAVLERNPRYADFYNLLADASVRTARYRQARDLARRAVEIDERSWQGWHHLGLNQLRLGQIEEGRANLEKAFAGDPYNIWIKNTLDLVDTFPEYRTVQKGRFELFLHEDEADVLEPLMAELAEEAYADMAARYGFEPPTPIRIEVYPDHADFSVRTVGLAGLGALGVCFGPVVALDSPSARQKGEANWGSTLWHELAHTFTLELTGARVPRWLTEGISVWEERRARPGWGDDVTPAFLEALLDDQLLPMEELNNGFVRPSFPTQIIFSYYQGSLVVERIVDKHGFEKLKAMLLAYRDGQGTEEVFRSVLGVELEEFDDDFFAWLCGRFASALASLEPGGHGTEEVDEGSEERESGDPHHGAGISIPGSQEELARMLEERAAAQLDKYRPQLAWGTWLHSQERHEEAVEVLERARDLFPEYVSDQSPHLMLAESYAAIGEIELAMERLRALVDVAETSWQGHRKLALMLERDARPAQAAAVLERALYIDPLDRDLQETLAGLWQELDRPEREVQARAAVVALEPPDRAGALYRLAEAELRAGDRTAARRSVLRALELAPGYDEAQSLLLRLVEESSS